MTIRVINTADWHLGATTNGVWSPDLGMNTTWAEAVKSLRQIVDICNDRDADLMVVAGDVFDIGRPPAEVVAMAVSELNRLTRTKVIFEDGNHDQSGVVGSHRTPVGAYLSEQRWCAGYASNCSIIDFDGLQLAMVPWHRVAGTASLSETSMTLRDNVKRLADEITGPSLLYGHLVLDELTFGPGGGVHPDRGSETIMSTSVLEASISLDELNDGPWMLARSGHIHKRQSIYLGSIYRVDYSEADQPKGVELIEIEGDRVTHKEFIELDTRQLYDLDLSETGLITRGVFEEISAGDIVTMRFDHDQDVSSRAHRQLRDLEGRGAYVRISVNPKTRTDTRVSHIGLGVSTDRREAMSAYVKDKWGDDPDTVLGVMRVFDDACDEYQKAISG